jgi:hypothetical protein
MEALYYLEITLKNSKCMVKIQGELSQLFGVRSGARQGDHVSTVLFTLTLECAIIDIIISL